MRIGRPKLILNPYDWLPGYGESKVSFCSMGMDAILSVEYEREEQGTEDCDALQSLRRDIRFKHVRAFIRVPFPGGVFFEFSGDSSNFGLGELTEFVDSEWADSSIKEFRSLSADVSPAIRHFSIQFLSENIAFHVLAEAVSLSNEQFVV